MEGARTAPSAALKRDQTLRDGRPVLPGVAGRFGFVDAPGHAAGLERYRARGYAMKNNQITIVTDHDADLVEVHPPFRGSVELKWGGSFVSAPDVNTAG